MVEEVTSREKKLRPEVVAAAGPLGIPTLAEVVTEETLRLSTGMAELDQLLGGGQVQGSVILLGGEPGVGKSTLLLTVAAFLCRSGIKTLYVSGEESLHQIHLRAQRLGLGEVPLHVLAETRVEQVLAAQEKLAAEVMIVDSVQTLMVEELASAPGSVGQIREVASALQTAAKRSGCVVWLVGHVTKDGNIAGPKVLEHLVDVVIYFEGEGRQPYRALRAVKNRFGATQEVALFEMRGEGLQPVTNPSGLLLAERPLDASGTVVVPVMEGSRPLLVEIQALVARGGGGSPRRASLGVEASRVNLLAAVLERAGLPLFDRDLFVNAVGGLKVVEPAADLGIALAIASSMRMRPIAHDILIVGEVGLAGEVRGVSQLELRLTEAARHGFRSAVLPPRLAGIDGGGMRLIPVKTLEQALDVVLDGG